MQLGFVKFCTFTFRLIPKRFRLTSGSSYICFTGNAGNGKTTVALKMADILYKLGYIRKGHLLTVTRDDLELS